MPSPLTASIVWVLAVGQHLQAFLKAWWGRCLAGAPKPCSGTSLSISHLVTVINTQEPGSGGQQLLLLYSPCSERGSPSSRGQSRVQPRTSTVHLEIVSEAWGSVLSEAARLPGMFPTLHEAEKLCPVAHSLVSSGVSSCCLSLWKSLRILHKFKSASASRTTAVGPREGWGDLFMSESESVGRSVKPHSFATHGL